MVKAEGSPAKRETRYYAYTRRPDYDPEQAHQLARATVEDEYEIGFERLEDGEWVQDSNVAGDVFGLSGHVGLRRVDEETALGIVERIRRELAQG